MKCPQIDHQKSIFFRFGSTPGEPKITVVMVISFLFFFVTKSIFQLEMGHITIPLQETNNLEHKHMTFGTKSVKKSPKLRFFSLQNHQTLTTKSTFLGIPLGVSKSFFQSIVILLSDFYEFLITIGCFGLFCASKNIFLLKSSCVGTLNLCLGPLITQTLKSA